MRLLTLRRLRAEIPSKKLSPGIQNGAVVPVRRSIASALFDAVLLVAPTIEASVAERIAVLLRRGAYRVSSLTVPPAGKPAPDCSHFDDAQCILIPLPERTAPTGPWLWWLIGRAHARHPRVALFPLPRRDPHKPITEFRPRPDDALLSLPYIGFATAAGEAVETLWVVPGGGSLDSREAVNFDFWLHERY